MPATHPDGTMNEQYARLQKLPLGQKQRRFAVMVARLIEFATIRGYEVTFGDAKSRREYGAHSKKSCHYIRLAVDLNLFRNGLWLRKTEDHAELGEYWERIGGEWGGHFRDGNHYSVLHRGRK